jgi:hypothetical protein
MPLSKLETELPPLPTKEPLDIDSDGTQGAYFTKFSKLHFCPNATVAARSRQKAQSCNSYAVPVTPMVPRGISSRQDILIHGMIGWDGEIVSASFEKFLLRHAIKNTKTKKMKQNISTSISMRKSTSKEN